MLSIPNISAMALEAENTCLRQEILSDQGWGDIVGRSASLRRVLAKIESVASTDSTVLLRDETHD